MRTVIYHEAGTDMPRRVVIYRKQRHEYRNLTISSLRRLHRLFAQVIPFAGGWLATM